MIEVYFEIGPDTQAKLLTSLFERHHALFKIHVQNVRELIGELLAIDPDKKELTILHDPTRGITHFTYPNFQNDIHEFNKECGNIFIELKEQNCFTWQQDPKVAQNDILCNKLNEVIPDIKHPNPSMLWPLFGREAYAVCPSPKGPVNSPGIIVNDGIIEYVVGNEYTLFGEGGKELPLMEGVRQIDPMIIIKKMIKEFGEKVDEVNEQMYGELTFSEASTFIIPFGKYKDKTIDEISSDDEGLKYLVWLYEERKKENKQEPIDLCLDIYLNDETIAKDWK